MSDPILLIPEGMKMVETDEFVMGMRSAYTKRGAERLMRECAARRFLPTYSLRVEKITSNPFTWERWAVNDYQNRLVKM